MRDRFITGQEHRALRRHYEDKRDLYCTLLCMVVLSPSDADVIRNVLCHRFVV